MIQLGEICTKASSNIAQKDLENCDGSYPIYGASGLIKHVDFYQQENPYVAVVKDGAGVGRVMQLPAKSSVIGTMQYIIPNEGISVQYLAYAMEYLNLAKYYTGATIPHIYFKNYCKEYLPAHDIDEQYHIALVLDKIANLISLRKQQLTKLDELVKARFMEMFGDPIANQKKWPVKRLVDIAELITNGTTPKGGSENYIDSGILFLRSQNIWRNRIELDDVAYIDQETHVAMKKSSVHYKDILITKTGRINTENSSLGRAALFLGENDSANINGHVYLVRLNEQVVPEFVVTILTGEAYRKYIRKVCVGGIDKRQINLEQVEEFPIILPPIAMQKQFAIIINEVCRQKLTIQQSLDKLEVLKNSLMQEYFGGEGEHAKL